MFFIPRTINAIAENVAKTTRPLTEHVLGKLFLLTVLVGPATFIPTLWEAMTAPNIDVLRTSTWPMMTMINIAGFISVCHRGDWRMRLVTFLWVLMTATLTIVTIVR
jgi:hypothetical protein